MSEEVDTRVSLSLHPLNVEKIDGYDETTAVYLGQVQTAFSEAYLGLGQVHTARDKARTNPTWNEAQQLIQTQDYADKVFARVARQMDSAKGNLDRSIAALDAQLTGPITAKAAQSVSAEIRSFAKGLATSERLSFMQRAIAGGDETTITALLGAPSYLSGIDVKTQEVFTRLWHERNSPEIAQRVRAMKGARDLIIDRGALLHGQFEKAVGVAPHKVAALRAAKNEAEQAFVLKQA